MLYFETGRKNLLSILSLPQGSLKSHSSLTSKEEEVSQENKVKIRVIFGQVEEKKSNKTKYMPW